jgi:RimJ/RimL family protein N-acetyltransferase
MSSRPALNAPAHYDLRVQGHLDEHWSSWFGGLTLIHEGDSTTTLRGEVTDQAELHGLLAKLRDLGATLISVKSTDVLVGAMPGPEGLEPPAKDCHDVRVSSPPLDAITWPVRTDRLTLRPATPDDLEATWQFRRLDDVNRWLTRAPATLQEYRTRFGDPASLAKTLVVELDTVVIGDLLLQVDDAWAQAEVVDQTRGVQAELGWVLHPAHTGHGYATEAVRELIRLCFEDLGLRRVTANCFAANDASWRLMERVGMRRELYTVRDSLHRCGEWLDGMGYALLADEWRGIA